MDYDFFKHIQTLKQIPLATHDGLEGKNVELMMYQYVASVPICVA